MRIEGKQALLLSDTLVPDVFISDHMMGLSAGAVKCYLYYLMACKNHKTVSEKDLSGRLGFSLEEIKGVMSELTMAGLVEWNDKGKVTILDIKESEIDGYIRQKQNERAAKPKEIRPEDENRDNLARSVEKTFFHGSMGYKWYRELDILWEEFSFAPDVIYNLFHYCSEKKRLTSVRAFHETALLWNAKGIKTAGDLSVYLEKETEITQTMRKLAKRLRRRMTDFDEEYVRVWIENLPYPYDVIDFAVRRMCEFNNSSTLKIADELLKEWFLRNLFSLSEIEGYEQEKAEKNRKRYQDDKNLRTPLPKASAKKENFEPAVYNDTFLKGLEVDLEKYRDVEGFI